VLSERDRRALEEIELHLAVQDPGFAASMEHPRPDLVDRWTRCGYDAFIVLGAATAVLCFVLLLICAAVVALLVVGASCHLRENTLPLR
jgi:disulfide bond formation protein DsbB